VDRKFAAVRPNELWPADLTYCSTWEGWLYISRTLDAHSRMIVGWRVASFLRTKLVLASRALSSSRVIRLVGTRHTKPTRRLTAVAFLGGRMQPGWRTFV
jgi:putative transposase